MKKYKIHVIQNSHTDLGYTHRQEYVYRAHARYLTKVLKIVERNASFRWTMENFWMFENFAKWSSNEQLKKLKKAIDDGKIEITGNYLNLLNILDKDAYGAKVKNAKEIFPQINVAVQQDVNSINKEQALVLSKNGIKNIYASIHTHHGMFVGEGKQRGFIWDLGDGEKVTVWGGEHYMLGNEMFMHQETPNKYTFKDNVEKKIESGFEQGLTRLKSYLDLMDEEKYPYKTIPIVLSGTVIDNSPPNENIVDGIIKLNEAIEDRAEVVFSTMSEFFDEINKEQLPTFKGSWPSWWVDGVISTPEAVRQYREAQVLYKNIMIYNKKKNLDQKLISDLEQELLMFAEHTWGSWSSQGNPFANGNNLLLGRKVSMATNASQIAWTLWDEIKEKEGYNIVKVIEQNKYKVINIHNKKIDKLVALEIPRSTFGSLEIDKYVDKEDSFEIVDLDGNKYPATFSPKMGMDDNINSSIESNKVILARVALEKNESKELHIIRRELKHNAGTSSFRPIGIDNADDVVYPFDYNCKYLRDGIESPWYIIKWNNNGIYSIYDKKNKVELLDTINFIRPIRVVSNGDSRNAFGRNRQGPSAKYSYGKLVSHKVISNKDTLQVIKLIFKMDGSKKTEINVRVTSLDSKIRFELLLHKTGTQFSENVYVDVPLISKVTHINSESGFFKAGIDQLPLTNIDYYKVYQGAIFDNGKTQVGLYTQDNPLLQLGSIKYEQRKLMGNDTNLVAFPKIWIMNNYWETNYKGTLEGTYSFAFDISSSTSELEYMQENHLKLLAFKIWK